MNSVRFFSRSSAMGLMCLSTNSLPGPPALLAGAAAPLVAWASPVAGREADSSQGSSLLPASHSPAPLSVSELSADVRSQGTL